MAVRFREGRASPWQCYWNNPLTGKRECANFGTRKEAEKHDSLIKHRIKFDRESFQKEEIEKIESPHRLTLEACYLEYLKEKQFSKKSLSWQMDAMRPALEAFKDTALPDIDRTLIEQLMKQLMQASVKPVTVRNRLSVLRTVLRWCAEKGYRGPVDFPKLPPARYEKFIPPTREELSAIIAAAAPHIFRVVILGSQFGVRVGPSELTKLTWADVDFDKKVLRIHGAAKNIEAPWREVPIKSSLTPLLKAWFDEDRKAGMISLIHYKNRPVSDIKKAWRGALRRAGITRRIRPYDLRHAFATEMLASGETDFGTVAKLMGHSNPAMLFKHYQYVMDAQKRTAVEALPDIPYVPGNMCPKN